VSIAGVSLQVRWVAAKGVLSGIGLLKSLWKCQPDNPYAMSTDQLHDSTGPGLQPSSTTFRRPTPGPSCHRRGCIPSDGQRWSHYLGIKTRKLRPGPEVGKERDVGGDGTRQGNLQKIQRHNDQIIRELHLSGLGIQIKSRKAPPRRATNFPIRTR
jgi:hypothetical protein